MHMIETTRLHIEPSTSDPLLAGDTSYSPHVRKRIYYIAQLFNTWISYDYGRCRVIPRGASCSLPGEDWTADEIAIWRLTDSLDPDRRLDSTELENLLLQASELTLSHSALELKRCNIALCIYRRLRVSGRVVSSKALSQVLHLTDIGIDNATEMARRHLPWWHIVNVPFQIICVLLAIDTRASLERVGKSVSTLRLVASVYGTSAIQDTFVSACSLIRIHMRRKMEDYELLSRVEEDMMAWEGDSSVLPPSSLPNAFISQPVEMPKDDVGESWDLDFLLSSSLFTPWG
ncbi:hypothetical protein BDV39DRAFT_172056 [Aspergillus sergii]|uniref:Transcription factor domain-containing protein n=1 Tax=Aspergillus sergii TaxID=1034303 RepID=A0A5N6X8U0_9EURO|nr:hypothetical protein BDV39DRAFT_172056 [Aspergillus sergii]